MRAAKGSTITITTEPFDSAPESATAAAVRADGTEIDPAPACVVAGQSVAVTLTAEDHLDQLDTLTVTVTADLGDDVAASQVVEVDVIGSHWVTIGALRQEPGLDDSAKYPTALLTAVRDEWEAWIEELCNLRMTPGYGVLRVRGDDCATLVLPVWEPTALRAVILDGTALDVEDFTLDRDGRLTRTGGAVFDAEAMVEVHVEHGLTRPDGRLVREVRKAVTRELKQRAAKAPTDVIREVSPDGGVTLQYSTPDPMNGRYTGILTLDPVIHRLRQPRFGLG